MNHDILIETMDSKVHCRSANNNLSERNLSAFTCNWNRNCTIAEASKKNIVQYERSTVLQIVRNFNE